MKSYLNSARTDATPGQLAFAGGVWT